MDKQAKLKRMIEVIDEEFLRSCNIRPEGSVSDVLVRDEPGTWTTERERERKRQGKAVK